jgi:hypothetical protein
MNIGNPDEFTLLEPAETIIELTSSKSGIVHEALPTDICPSQTILRTP